MLWLLLQDLEKLKKLKAEKLYGTYKTILTERGQNSSVDANATTSKNITLEENGKVTGVYCNSKAITKK